MLIKLLSPSNVTEVKNLQLWNAFSPIPVTLFGMTIEVNELQSSNVRLPMLVTLYVVPFAIIVDASCL